MQKIYSLEELESIADRVDTTHLDEEIENNDSYYKSAITHAKQAFLTYESEKLACKKIIGSLWQGIRQASNESLLKMPKEERTICKFNESDKEAILHQMDEYIEAQDRINKAEAHKNYCEGLMRVFSMRNNSIDNLTKLVLGKFVSLSSRRS